MSEFQIKSEGDLEAIVLHENKNAFAAIINKDLYEVLGDPPHQQAMFHNASCFDLFCIHVFELLAEREVTTGNKKRKQSLFTGAGWLAIKYEADFEVGDLKDSIKCLEEWLGKTVNFSFWCGDINRQVEFPLTRRKGLRFAHLFSKHNLLNLTRAIGELSTLCDNAGPSIDEKDLLHLIKPFLSELKQNRTIYNSCYLIEMLYNYFVALNRLGERLYGRSPTNDLERFKYPDGISSDAFKNMYYWALHFAKNYSKSHYSELKPHTTKYLRMRNV